MCCIMFVKARAPKRKALLSKTKIRNSARREFDTTSTEGSESDDAPVVSI